MKPVLFLAALSAAGLFQTALAQDAKLSERLARCRQIADGAQRLACYDELAGAPAAAARPVTPPRESAAPVAAAPPAAQAVAPAPVAAAAPANPVAEFGMERESAKKLDAIDSFIDGNFDGWKNRQRFRLGNGQLWEVTDGTSGVYLTMRNPKVTIKRGLIGGFLMDIENVNQRLRVKRLE